MAAKHHEPKRAWKTGLLDMAAEPDGRNRCCQTLWCAPCAYGRMAEKENAPEDVWGKGSCVKGTLIFSCLPHLTMAVADNVTRKEHNIEGNCLFDVWNAVMCMPCMMCRQAREVDLKSA